jgi:hypothetical protein
MEQKTPVLLVILVETARLRWFVASIGLDGATTPLICSEADDLEKYRGLEFDEQVAFLRHRFCGVLQRGCDRLWARNCKACQFVFVFDGLLPERTGQLTQALAGHFAEWLLKPPVAVFVRADGNDPSRLDRLSGTLDAPLEQLLLTHLERLRGVQEDATAWELARQNGVWCVRPAEG